MSELTLFSIFDSLLCFDGFKLLKPVSWACIESMHDDAFVAFEKRISVGALDLFPAGVIPVDEILMFWQYLLFQIVC